MIAVLMRHKRPIMARRWPQSSANSGASSREELPGESHRDELTRQHRVMQDQPPAEGVSSARERRLRRSAHHTTAPISIRNSAAATMTYRHVAPGVPNVAMAMHAQPAIKIHTKGLGFRDADSVRLAIQTVLHGRSSEW